MKLSDFSLLKEDNDSYQIGHPQGKSITVPKSGLNEKAQKLVSQLKREQHLADAGEVQSETPANPTPAMSSSAVDSPESIANDAASQAPPEQAAANQSGTVPASAEQQANPNAGALPVAQENAGAAIQGADASPFGSQSGLLAAKKSIQGGVSAEATQGRTEASIQKGLAESLANPTFEQKFQDYQNKQATLDHALNTKLDPNRYLNNMGLGSKISSGIAMILGGIGGGLTHQTNPALAFMQNAIDRDIDAQKSDKSSAMNLWKMNRENYDSDIAATLATQNQSYAATKAKMLQAASTAKGGLAGQNAAQAILGIDQKTAMNNWMLSRATGGAPGSENDYVADLNKMKFANPEIHKDMQEKYIPSVGTTKVPPTPGDRGEATAYDQIENALKQAQAFSLAHGRTMWGSDLNAEANSIRQDLVTGYQQLHDLKRLSDVDLKLNLSNISSPGAWNQGSAMSEFKNMQTEVQNKRNVLYNHLGVQPFQKAPINQQALGWAKANPQSPYAAQIMQRLGVQ